MNRVVIDIRSKCRSEALLYGYPPEYCDNIVPEADLSVYSKSGIIWYEEFDSMQKAIDSLKIAVKERAKDGWVCKEIEPARFANEKLVYECMRGEEKHILVVHSK